jgi:hypothetical protein
VWNNRNLTLQCGKNESLEATVISEDLQSKPSSFYIVLFTFCLHFQMMTLCCHGIDNLSKFYRNISFTLSE